MAAFGLAGGLGRVGVRPGLAVLAGLVVALIGVQALWAGAFPMPDPRHGGHPAFVAGMLALPPLLLVACWTVAGPGLRAYLAANLWLLAAMVPLMSGMAGLDTRADRGLIQRLVILAIFPPIGVVSFAVGRRLRALGG